jgi:RecA/RadA recombinase
MNGEIPPDALAWNGLDVAPTYAELEAEAHAAADADPIARHELAYLTPERIAMAAEWRVGVEASARRAGFASVAEYLDAVDPVPDRRATAEPAPFPEPEDRGTATLSALGDVETIGDLVRPGRIATVAAEEGSGKSFLALEMAVRVAVAGGSFAGTWPVLRTGPVLYLSEMHADDDYGRESTVLDSLELERPALTGRYYRLPLMTAAGGRPALTVPEWRAWVTGWLRDHGALLLIVDTATGATQVDPWGRDIQAVYSGLRVMLAEYPELAIVLLIHLKKPQGRGERRISDVLGEWGRWCDVVILMENEGNGLTRARLTVRKRVRRERRVVVTKAGGLLIDPQDLDEAKGTKVPLDDVLAAIVAAPGITYAELGAVLGVSRDTAGRYVGMLGDQVDQVKGIGKSGPGARMRLFPVVASSHVVAQARCDDSATTHEAIEESSSGESSHRRIASIDATTPRKTTTASPDGLRLSVGWPEI